MLGFKALLKKILPRWLYSPFLSPYHWVRAVAANIKYGYPARGLNVIAVTGTNGKTTTANYIAAILEAAGYKVGLSTTALFKIGDEVPIRVERASLEEREVTFALSTVEAPVEAIGGDKTK